MRMAVVFLLSVLLGIPANASSETELCALVLAIAGGETAPEIGVDVLKTETVEDPKLAIHQISSDDLSRLALGPPGEGWTEVERPKRSQTTMGKATSFLSGLLKSGDANNWKSTLVNAAIAYVGPTGWGAKIAKFAAEKATGVDGNDVTNRLAAWIDSNPSDGSEEAQAILKLVSEQVEGRQIIVYTVTDPAKVVQKISQAIADLGQET